MYHKNIKLSVRKQLKKQFPNWKRLPKKQKKDIAQKVLAEAIAEHNFSQVIASPKEQLPTRKIIKLDQMPAIPGGR
ncbi:MAG TPA: hypothetical protein ENG79_08485 [Desulfobacteraceae bacterium]|nr:hypothetical protein BMS3Abin13_00893 [bacterium BMS3Abin13]HDL98916.1 hypothetical protein [Desulfobacteraceae bacterium]HDO31072.1 hypothetical protein [Desulfobacteraceae bacterium]